MAPRKNQLVANWLAAYCGDEQFLFPQVFGTIKQRRSVETDNGWPTIDSESEAYRMLQRQGPMRIENLAPSPKTAAVATTIESGGLRATLEAVSDYQFSLRGFLVDLANENAFADRVLTYLSDFGTIAPAVSPRNASKTGEVDDESEFTRSYAGTASVPAKTFVGEVIFSDFACFELQGIVQGQTEPGWNAEFLADLRGFLELLSTTEST